MAQPIRKLISMQGYPGPAGNGSNLGSLLSYVVASSSPPYNSAVYYTLDYIAATCDWVRIVISWDGYALSNMSGMTIQQTFAALDTNFNWRYLDNAIANANARGLSVILCVNCDGTPTWARDPEAATAYSRSTWAQANRHQSQLPPANVGPNSPYAYFLSYCVSRYLQAVPAGRAPSPRSGLNWGNDWGAYVANIEPLNEPNYLWWPQQIYYPGSSTLKTTSSCLAAQAIETAMNVCVGWYGRTGVFGPSTLDVVGTDSVNWSKLDYANFTQNVLTLMQNWVPPLYLGWAIHNYGDMKTLSSARINNVISLLNSYGRTTIPVWATEGGYARNVTRDSATEDNTQLQVVATALQNAAAVPRQRSQAQHQVWSDVNFDSGFLVPHVNDLVRYPWGYHTRPASLFSYGSWPGWGGYPKAGSP